MNDDWSWTNKLWLIVYEPEDGGKDEYLLRARTKEEALRLFLETRAKDVSDERELTLADAWSEAFNEIEYIFELPTNYGLTGIVGWHSQAGARSYGLDDCPPVPPRLIATDKQREDE